jgi:photosynthetic reaction center cytochrome c subunit
MLLLLSERVRILTNLGTTVLVLMPVMLAAGQTGPGQKPPMAENVFKNVQVLKGIPVDEFMSTMGFLSASLGMTCTDCHVAESGGSWEKYADDTELKQTSRKMLVMVSALNRTYFGGRREVTCYSCHRGGDRPKVTPSLIELYSAPAPPEPPDSIEQASQARPADPILDKYIQALGGAQRLGNLTSFAAKGTYMGFGETDKTPLEIFAKAPDQRTMIVHTPIGDSMTIYNRRTGWTAAPAANTPVPVLEITGGELEGAKIDAELAFPGRIKQSFRQLRAGAPATIDDHEVQVVQGTSDGRYPVDFYFDGKSSLLVRIVRFSDSPVGLNPTQIDYADYREVAGVKMPFRWTVTWLSGRSTIELTEVRPNVPIDAAKFAKPKISSR